MQAQHSTQMQSTSSGAMAQRPVQSSFQPLPPNSNPNASASTSSNNNNNNNNQSTSNTKTEDPLKKLESEITNHLKKFNDPATPEDSLDELRRLLSHLYNEKGVLNCNRQEFLDAIHDYTRALEFHKTDVSFINRGMVFVKFELPKQAFDDMSHALTCNPKNRCATMVKKTLEEKYAAILNEL